MRNFTEYITESYRNFENQDLSYTELDSYSKAVQKDVSDEVRTLLYLSLKCNLLTTELVDSIRNSSKSSLETLSRQLNAEYNDIVAFWSIISKMKDHELRALPQYQNAQEREAVLSKKLRVSDLTIDLESDKGKRDVIKQYTPLMHKIVNQFVGRSKLTRADLMSAALVGFNDAINNWNPNSENAVSFKTFAGYSIRQQILNDINTYSHSLTGTSWYAKELEKQGKLKLDGLSLDHMMGDDNKLDHMASLGREDKDADDSKLWKEVFAAIENKFKVRDVDIFYRYFGLNGRQKEKSKDIAKSYGMSEGNIRNAVINKMINFLRNDNHLRDIFIELQDIYNEGLMIEMIHMDRQQILEALLNDDTFILLEEINRWTKGDTFNDAVSDAVDSIKNGEVIMNILNGNFDDLDSQYKKNKKDIIEFLSNMYPTESFVRKTDVEIIDRMAELQEIYKKFNK